jgi:hypothetical protein
MGETVAQIFKRHPEIEQKTVAGKFVSIPEMIAANQAKINKPKASTSGALNEADKGYQTAIDRLKESASARNPIAALRESLIMIKQSGIAYGELKFVPEKEEDKIIEAKTKKQMAEDISKTIEGLLEHGVRLQGYEGLIDEFDEEQIPEHLRRKLIPWFLDINSALGKQFKIAEEVGELAEIEKKIGAKAIICDPKNDNIKQLLVGNDFGADTPAIAISHIDNQEIFKKAGVKVLPLKGFEDDRYVDLLEMAVYSKLMLYIATITDDPKVTGKLRSLAIRVHKQITGVNATDRDIDNFLKEGTMVIAYSLPPAEVKYKDGQLEDLHKQAKEALKAA